MPPQWLQKFFMYLDRYYVKHHSLATLAISGLRHFKTLVYDEVKKDVANAMLVIVDSERQGKDIDRALLKSVVELFETMGMGGLDAYTEDLEEVSIFVSALPTSESFLTVPSPRFLSPALQPLLASTRDFYARRREEWISSDSTPDYLIKAESALEEEKQRVLNYLNSHSEPKVLRVCEEEVSAPRLDVGASQL